MNEETQLMDHARPGALARLSRFCLTLLLEPPPAPPTPPPSPPAPPVIQAVETSSPPPEPEPIEDPPSQDPAPNPPPTREEIDAAISHVYRLALSRTPSSDECSIWAAHVLSGGLNMARFVDIICTSPEALAVQSRTNLLPQATNGWFVQFSYERILGRGAMADEIVHWDFRMRERDFRRDQLLIALFSQRGAEELEGPAPLDPGISYVMGTGGNISVAEWSERAAAVRAKPPAADRTCTYPDLALVAPPKIRVSAVASLYRGGEFIEQFLHNITSQTIFVRHCELIIIDADSPENEYETIARYMERFPNIVYHRAKTRIGIYEAWNVGVEMARGEFITNANLDDLRRNDSFERQLELLEKFPFIDVVYQDFYYSFDGMATFEQTAAVGVQSKVPVITPYNLMRSNSPHNAPMWRRSLHQELGLFDTSFRSAGDYDFWLRCVEAGKVFFKCNDPHVVYFVNPQGLSTQPNTRGVEEGNRVTREHARKIISPWLISTDDEYCHRLDELVGHTAPSALPDKTLPDWRYAAAQQALRACSVASRGLVAGKV